MSGACYPRDICHPRNARRARRHLPSCPRYMSCEPHPPRGQMQAVTCGARSDTQLLDLHLEASRICPERVSVYIKPGPVFMLRSKRSIFSRTRIVIPQERNTDSSTPRCFRSCLDERAPVRRESASLTLSAPISTYPRRYPGPKRPRAARPQTPSLIRSDKKRHTTRPATYNNDNRFAFYV